MDARQRLNRKQKQKNRKIGSKKPSGSAGSRPVKSGAKRGANVKGVKGKKQQQQPVKTLTRKISDLRQIIATKPAVGKKTLAQKKTGIKKRLGLQSNSARERSQKGAGGQAVRSNPQKGQRVGVSRPVFTRPETSGFVSAAPAVSSRPAGNAVVVSNLNSSVTQSDILELFSDVGPVVSYTSINTSTAMITYASARDAAAAVQEYDRRALDGRPMHVTLIPATNVAPENPIRRPAGNAPRRVVSRTR